MNNLRILPSAENLLDVCEAGGRLLTVQEAAQTLSVSERTFWRMVKEKEIRVVKIRNCLRIDPADIRRYVRNHKSRGI